MKNRNCEAIQNETHFHCKWHTELFHIQFYTLYCFSISDHENRQVLAPLMDTDTWFIVDGPESNPGMGPYFSHVSTLALGTVQPSIQWILGHP